MILGRFYKSDMNKLIVDAFREKILIPRKFDKPIHLIDGFSFLYVRSDSVYVVGASGVNGNATMIFQFLYDVIALFRSYFDDKFDEQSFRNNFTLVYELLDEVYIFIHIQPLTYALLPLFRLWTMDCLK